MSNRIISRYCASSSGKLPSSRPYVGLFAISRSGIIKCQKRLLQDERSTKQTSKSLHAHPHGKTFGSRSYSPTLSAMDRPQLARVPSDTVIPLHSMDDDDVFRSTVLELSHLFNDQLDVQKLHDALWKLIDRGNWKKLGARLRLNENERLEYHVPETFDRTRPPFAFSSEHIPSKLKDHPLTRSFHKRTSNVSIVGNPAAFRSFTRAPDAASSLADFLTSDRPQLTVRVVTFEDATVISFNWPHTFMDGMGFRMLMDYWIMALENRLEDVPPFFGYDVDPFTRLGDKAAEDYVMKKWIAGDETIKRLQERAAFATTRAPTVDEARVICVPSHEVVLLKDQASKELKDRHLSGSGSKDAFLSDGNIISAWWSRILIQALNPPRNRLVCVRNSLSIRHILEDEVIPKGSAYMANALMGTYTLLPAADILTKPLSYVAATIRQDILAQSTRGQVEAFQAAARDFKKKTKRRIFIGDDNTIQLMFTNINKGKFYDMDFSAAVAREGTPVGQRPNALGKVIYQQYEGHFASVENLFIFVMMGKDPWGNYWLSGKLPQRMWDLVDKQLPGYVMPKL